MKKFLAILYYLGLLEAVLLALVWRSEESAASLVSSMGGEDPWSSA